MKRAFTNGKPLALERKAELIGEPKGSYKQSWQDHQRATLSVNEQLQKAVSYALEAGYQLDSEAFTFLETLSKTEDALSLIEKIVAKIDGLPQKPLFIGRSILEEFIAQTTKTSPEPTVEPLPEPFLESKKESFKPFAKEIDSEIQVLEDPTSSIRTSGSIQEYHDYFLDRFARLQKFLRQRIDAKDASSINDAMRSPANSKVKIIGMLTEKRESKQRIFLRLEDQESFATVLVNESLEGSVRDRVHSLLLDQVICIVAVKTRNDLLVLEDVLFPEVPQRTPRKATEPVHAALISDLHVGSRQFIREAFNRFLLWLNGKFGDANWREIASHVKYVIIAGDLVDGVGIYPRQLKDLLIRDIYKQYSVASRFLEQIPDYVQLIIIPGNHDASRKALPQPSLPKEYAEPICETHEVKLLGNPSSLTLHGVEFLLYHGRSLDDVIANAPDISFKTPEKAMRLLLRSRHLAPIYGQRTPIAPGKRDFLVIERVPDIFHAGHVHVQAVERYRGVLLVNSGAWQGRTEYQSKMGLEPNPGVVPIVNLQTLQVTTLNFNPQPQKA